MEKKSFKQKLPTIIFLTLLIIVGVILARKKYYALVLCLIGIYTIALCGLDILFGYSGQISFGHAAFYAIGAYTSAVLTTKFNWSPIPAMLIGVILSTLSAVIIAIPACRLRKHFLSVLTSTFGQLVVLLVTNMQITGAATGLMSIPKVRIFGYVLKSRQQSLIFITIVAALALFIKHRIVDSKVGRAFLAIKQNTVAAQGLGINVRFYKTLAFAICAMYASVAGSLYAYLMSFISPESFDGVQSTLFITTILLGGLQSNLGPLVGSLVILPLKELLQQFADYQGIAFAVITILSLFFFPNGIIGITKQVRDSIVTLLKKNNTGKESRHAEN